ncbi:hypothetical protein Z950_3033 [Sulfitobacter mediterraneus KCTC 32188]|nr:hypothetical protein Z950_3033 [Sulfitobacter mediterraneus KCTC 32188]
MIAYWKHDRTLCDWSAGVKAGVVNLCIGPGNAARPNAV